jgi:hypothetical protein
VRDLCTAVPTAMTLGTGGWIGTFEIGDRATS